jgi:hypothetical protein
MQTRREFLMTSAMCAYALGGAPAFLPAISENDAGRNAGAPLLHGDPYTAHVDEHGLGGRSFEAARHHALRFRSMPDDRDRFVLGLEV